MRANFLIWLAATFPLAACLSVEGGASTRSNDARDVRTELPLYGGNVVVRGPRGYCVDVASLRRQGNSSLVFLASCESLSGTAGISVEPALMVVNVLARTPGRAQPTATGIATSMAPKQALRAIDGDGISLVHLDSGGNLAFPGSDTRYWRAGMVINDHLVSLAVYGRQGSPVAGNRGKALIIDLAESLREASPARRYVSPEDTAPAPDDSTTSRDTGTPLSGLFPSPG